jgi:hypothetical protein
MKLVLGAIALAAVLSLHGLPGGVEAVQELPRRLRKHADGGGSLTLHLVEGFTPQPFSGDRRVNYVRKQHAIIFAVMRVKGRKMEGFAKLLVSYWQGGMARAEPDKHKTRS